MRAEKLLSVVICACLPILSIAQFQKLGNLGGSAPFSQANGMSSNGEYVVGQSNSPAAAQGAPFIWSAAKGMLQVPETKNGSASGVSLDGAVVGGMTELQVAGKFSQFVFVNLPASFDTFAQGSGTFAALAGNGSVAVGWNESDGAFDPVQFIPGKGLKLYPLLSGMTEGGVNCVSDDATVAAGQCENSETVVPVYWDSKGVHAIPIPSPLTLGMATAISADGGTVAGYMGQLFPKAGVPGREGFVYSISTGITTVFPTTTLTKEQVVSDVSIKGVSNGGKIAVGNWDGDDLSTQTSTGGSLVWTTASPALSQDAGTYLTQHGAAPDAGYVSLEMAGVSADGKTFCGTISPPSGPTEAFRAVVQIQLEVLTLAQSKVEGGHRASGTVAINDAPDTGQPDFVVDLSSSNTNAADVAVSVSFVPDELAAKSIVIETKPVTIDTAVTITASAKGIKLTKTLTVQKPLLASLKLSPASVAGGDISDGTVTLAEATDPSFVVELSSSNAAAGVPVSLTIPPGAVIGKITINTSPVTVSSPCEIEAKEGSVTLNQTLTVNPSSFAKFTLSGNPVVGGAASIGTLSLTGEAPSTGATFSISSANTTVATAPATVTIPFKSMSKTFEVQTKGVNASAAVSIKATYLDASLLQTLTVNPASLLLISPSVNTIVGGNAFTLRAGLNGLAGPAGDMVTLNLNTALTAGPHSAVIAAQDSSAFFAATTVGVATSSSATLSATLGSVTKSCTVKIVPASLAALTPSTAKPTAGASFTLTVGLNGLPPASAAKIALATTSASLAPVPAIVSLTANQRQAVLTIKAGTVTAPTPVTITATYDSVSLKATVTIEP